MCNSAAEELSEPWNDQTEAEEDESESTEEAEHLLDGCGLLVDLIWLIAKLELKCKKILVSFYGFSLLLQLNMEHLNTHRLGISLRNHRIIQP